MEKLIRIRERSLELSLKSLNSLSLAILKETFAFKNLKVKSISWHDSSAGVIEFIGKNDLVRPSNSWESLKKRLDGKSFKCYGLFHDKLREPVSFVYVKLSRGIPSNIFNLYETGKRDSSIVTYSDSHSHSHSDSDSCIFYSISSPFRGLNGVEFGAKLIKSVVEVVRADQPQIKTFATFSPIPLFRKWLQENSDRFENLTNLPAEELDSNETELMAACEEYLRTRHDPVARFHYRNGAKLGPLRFKADPSQQSYKQSYGIQVNYIYYE